MFKSRHLLSLTRVWIARLSNELVVTFDIQQLKQIDRTGSTIGENPADMVSLLGRSFGFTVRFGLFIGHLSTVGQNDSNFGEQKLTNL